MSGSVGRAIGLDVHRDFCEVAICAAGRVRSAGRIKTSPEELELFARSLGPEDRVALEVTGSAWEIARILEPHVQCRGQARQPYGRGLRSFGETARQGCRAHRGFGSLRSWLVGEKDPLSWPGRVEQICHLADV